jgi:hypothetical protein
MTAWQMTIITWCSVNIMALLLDIVERYGGVS